MTAPACDGKAQVGDRVSYEDAANPRRVGVVVAVLRGWGVEYRVRWDDGTSTVSDLRQAGWRRAGGA